MNYRNREIYSQEGVRGPHQEGRTDAARWKVETARQGLGNTKTTNAEKRREIFARKRRTSNPSKK